MPAPLTVAAAPPGAVQTAPALPTPEPPDTLPGEPDGQTRPPPPPDPARAGTVVARGCPSTGPASGAGDPRSGIARKAPPAGRGLPPASRTRPRRRERPPGTGTRRTRDPGPDGRSGTRRNFRRR